MTNEPKSKPPPIAPEKTLPKIEIEELAACVSSGRLRAYRRKDDNDLETITRYAWNISLCEAFYPAIQLLEVGLRNSIHNAASNSFGDPKWYKSGGLLSEHGQEKINKAEQRLIDMQRPPEPGRVIAELGFGFWVNLFNRRYERFWHRIIRETFPGMFATQRTRPVVHARFENIRNLRNRIFHHESILNRDLSRSHDSILEAMDWINPIMREIANSVDRFDEVYKKEYYDKLRGRLTSQSTVKSVE